MALPWNSIVYTRNQPRLKQPKRGLARALLQKAIQPQKMIETTAFQWPKHFRRKHQLSQQQNQLHQHQEQQQPYQQQPQEVRPARQALPRDQAGNLCMVSNRT